MRSGPSGLISRAQQFDCAEIWPWVSLWLTYKTIHQLRWLTSSVLFHFAASLFIFKQMRAALRDSGKKNNKDLVKMGKEGLSNWGLLFRKNRYIHIYNPAHILFLCGGMGGQSIITCMLISITALISLHFASGGKSKKKQQKKQACLLEHLTLKVDCFLQPCTVPPTLGSVLKALLSEKNTFH